MTKQPTLMQFFFCFLYLSSFYVNFYYGTSFVYPVCVCIVFTCSLVFALLFPSVAILSIFRIVISRGKKKGLTFLGCMLPEFCPTRVYFVPHKIPHVLSSGQHR